MNAQVNLKSLAFLLSAVAGFGSAAQAQSGDTLAFSCGRAPGITIVVNPVTGKGTFADATAKGPLAKAPLVPDQQGAWVNEKLGISFLPESMPPTVSAGDAEFKCKQTVAAAPPPPPPAPTGVKLEYAAAGPWTIEYYKRSQKSPKALFCSTTRIFASEVVVRFRLDGKSLDIDIMGDSTGALGPKVPVTYTLSSKSNKGVPAKATALLTTDPEGTEWLTVPEKGQPVGNAEALADADILTIRSQTKTWRYPIGDMTGPYQTLMECVEKFVM